MAGVLFPAEARNSSPQLPDRHWGPPSFLFNGYQGLFPGGKAAGHEADHSAPSSAEVKNGGAIPPLRRMSSWHNASFIKRKDNFTVTLRTLEVIYTTWRSRFIDQTMLESCMSKAFCCYKSRCWAELALALCFLNTIYKSTFICGGGVASEVAPDSLGITWGKSCVRMASTWFEPEQFVWLYQLILGSWGPLSSAETVERRMARWSVKRKGYGRTLWIVNDLYYEAFCQRFEVFNKYKFWFHPGQINNRLCRCPNITRAGTCELRWIYQPISIIYYGVSSGWRVGCSSRRVGPTHNTYLLFPPSRANTQHLPTLPAKSGQHTTLTYSSRQKCLGNTSYITIRFQEGNRGSSL
jgi:hypothetical protein